MKAHYDAQYIFSSACDIPVLYGRTAGCISACVKRVRMLVLGPNLCGMSWEDYRSMGNFLKFEWRTIIGLMCIINITRLSKEERSMSSFGGWIKDVFRRGTEDKSISTPFESIISRIMPSNKRVFTNLKVLTLKNIGYHDILDTLNNLVVYDSEAVNYYDLSIQKRAVHPVLDVVQGSTEYFRNGKPTTGTAYKSMSYSIVSDTPNRTHSAHISVGEVLKYNKEFVCCIPNLYILTIIIEHSSAATTMPSNILYSYISHPIVSYLKIDDPKVFISLAGANLQSAFPSLRTLYVVQCMICNRPAKQVADSKFKLENLYLMQISSEYLRVEVIRNYPNLRYLHVLNCSYIQSISIMNIKDAIQKTIRLCDITVSNCPELKTIMFPGQPAPTILEKLRYRWDKYRHRSGHRAAKQEYYIDNMYINECPLLRKSQVQECRLIFNIVRLSR